MKKTNKSKVYWGMMAFFLSVLLIIVLTNIFLIRTSESRNIDAEGQIELSNIAGSVENNLYRSECLLDSVIMQIEPMLLEGTAKESLTQYFNKETLETIREKSEGSCFSAYAAYQDELYINDFVPDQNFVLSEREWYIGAKRKLGKVNVSDPYIDANTGEMCYSISKLLSDGQTVVGLDFNMNELQTYIEEMNKTGKGTSLIVNEQGMILGHSNPEYVGKNYQGLPFYNELVNKVYMLYGDFFEYKADGIRYNVFSDKTDYDWYLIVCVKREALQGSIGSGAIMLLLLIVLLMVITMVCISALYRRKERAQTESSHYKLQLEDMQEQMQQTLFHLKNQTEFLENEVFDDAKMKSMAMESLGKTELAIQQLMTPEDTMEQNPEPREKRERKKKSEKNVNYRKIEILITMVLVATSIFAIVFNTNTQVEWGKTKMQKESDQYLHQVQEWITSNSATLDVIAGSIAAQPGFEDDYGKAIRYLDDIVSNYEDISVAYLCNPQWEHTVLMNNGWEPDADWHVEERQWYVDTMQTEDPISMAVPYLDEQTGLYCITLSKIVYDANGDFIGILGIDYYLDKLVDILGKSYTDTGYAFLTDIDGNILNHPNEQYQMKPDESQKASNLCYRTALAGDGAYIIRDYDGTYKACQAVTAKNLGFGIIVVRDVAVIYGNAIVSDVLYMAVFLICILMISIIMKKLSRWQSSVNLELREAADRAINAGKAKNDFLANMSHEIRTPINAVLGMNEMIMRESKEEEILGYAVNIQSAGRTLLSLINDILDFSKIESGKMEIIPVQYDVSSLINDLVQMISIRARKKNLEFIVEIDEKIPAVLYGDDVRVRQIITNILTNAVKYTMQGSVKLQMILVSNHEKTAQIKVSVADTGMGIREEDLDKLFQSFQRLEQRKNRNIEGTGLGITIVQRLLQMMGSQLTVTSVYGEGSTFSFVIEQGVVRDEMIGDYETKFRESVDSLTAKAVKTAADAHVLVVDDNETNLLVAKSLLKRTKVQADTASSGKECLEKLRTQFYHIVFLDHMMPEMDGIETLEIIRKENLAPDTVFVALTANAIRGAKENYLSSGFDDYLSKPISGKSLEKCLFSYLPENLIDLKQEEPGENQDMGQRCCVEMKNPESINLKTGLLYAGENIDDYHEILLNYVSRGEENRDHINHLFEEKNWKDYIIAVHALKSSSLTVGAEKLSEEAKELETEGKNENFDHIIKNHDHVMKTYENVIETGKAYLDECAEQEQHASTGESSENLHTTEELRELLMRLKDACDSFFSDDVIRICDELEQDAQNHGELKTLIDEIRTCAAEFEFGDAGEKTEALIQRMDSIELDQERGM